MLCAERQKKKKKDRGVPLIHRSSVKLRDVASDNWTTNLQIVGLHGY